MTDEIITTLETYLRNEILQQPDRPINPDEPLISSGLIDSFSLVDVALFVEDTYQVLIDDTELREAIQRAAVRYAAFFTKDLETGKDSRDQQSDRNPLVDEALRFIQRRYRDNVSLFEADEDLHITEGHLASLIKTHTKKTFVQLLTEYRLNVDCSGQSHPSCRISLKNCSLTVTDQTSLP